MTEPQPVALQKKQQLFLVLSGIFLTNALIAEIIGAKIFSIEALLGVEPAQIAMPGGFKLDFNLAAGAVNWPIVFVTSDVINEYYGRAGVKRISYLTAGFIAYSFIIIFIATLLPPAPFWVDVNRDPASFDIDYAFGKIFRQGLGIILGSITAFLLAQLLDASVFARLRRLTGNRKVWLRATGSTVVSQLVDTFVVLTVAFYIFGNWSLIQVFSVGIINYSYKFVVAVLMTPVIYLAHYLIDRYLGIPQARELSAQAAGEMPTAI
jgi:uncharacterized integral membrane protein (TIGR00697 family)